jgi:hypothetical protein
MPKQKMFSAAIAIALGAAAWGTTTSAEAAIPACGSATVAFVKQIDGSSESVRIKRAGSEDSLSVFAPLCEGDVVSLKTASDRVVLGVAGSSGPNEIRGPKSYTVGPASTGSQSISELIEGRLLPLGDRLVGQGLARSGGEFGFGLLDLETESAQIKSGFRPLWVGWTGGQAPYELLVLDPTDRIFATQTLSDTSTTLPARTITPGRYTIVVKDAYGRTRQTFFDAVEDVPATSAPSVPAWMGEDTAVMLAAFCVAAEDPYVWSYEAAQQISGAKDTGLDREAALALIGGGDSDALCPR